ncbi:MAG TPA: hypothetical protein VK563_14380 [Puia sp.]|nr:hypothetical protein [Puia sp.]
MPDYDKEYIIRYVDNELSAEERLRFEAVLHKDALLAAEVALYHELKATLQQRLPEDDTLAALRSRMLAMNGEYFNGRGMGISQTPGVSGGTGGSSPAGAKRIPLTRWLAGLAAAASVLIAVVLLWTSRDGNSLDNLGRTQMISTTERGSNADSLLQEAAGYFNKQEFDKALPLLNRAVKQDSSSQLALFYRGVAEWNTGATDSARKDLTSVFEGGSALQYEAAFYIALSFARQKDRSAAREWLKKIPEGAPISAKAKELLKKLG